VQWFSDDQASAIAAEILRTGAVCIQNCLNFSERGALLGELQHYPLVQQPSERGHRKVKQNFSAYEGVSSNDLFVAVRDAIQSHLQTAFGPLNVFVERLLFNELGVQTYPVTDVGISPHRDGESKINLVVIVVLEGCGRFFLCDDHAGSHPREVHHTDGDVIVLRGTGFGGSREGPIHCVGPILTPRTIFTLRQTQR
jgi:hypothetical protein